jgi:integrase
MVTKLTKRVVESIPLPPNAKTDSFVWDTETKGLGVRVTATGGRIYVLQTRVRGRLRKVRIGRHGAITVQQARTHAQRLLAEIAAGKDPISAMRKERSEGRDAPTVRELSDRYLAEHAEPHKKPRSVASDRSNLKLHVLPTLGTLRVAEVTQQDIAKLHHKMRNTPGAANRVLALLSKMLNLAEAWGLRPNGSNPTRHVKKYRESRRERFLSELELARLGKVLRKVEQEQTELPSVVPAIRILLFTGARLGEILTLRWKYVDEERHCLRLPDSKTGAKTIPLNAAVLEILEGLDSSSSPWVIRGGKDGRHLVNLEKPWRRIRKAAKLDDVRLHDLRHTFASIAASANFSLPVIGSLLGHKETATTQRYAHLADSPLRAASGQTGERIKRALARTPALSRIK